VILSWQDERNARDNIVQREKYTGLLASSSKCLDFRLRAYGLAVAIDAYCWLPAFPVLPVWLWVVFK